jgi:uncharacterized protein
MTTRPNAARYVTTALAIATISSFATVVVPAHADVRAGVTAWEAGDYARAVREWRPLAVAGDADAQFNLAQAYKLGRGVAVDLVQSSVWFRRAADQGHLQAQDNLGLVLYDMGQRAEALPYLQTSAERGEPRTQFVMGAELFNGERISRDLPRAYAYMKRASDAGLQRAAAALVQMDGAIPLEQRREGLALAAAMEASEGQARLAAMTATAPPRASRPATIRPTELPPSQAGTTYSPPPIAPAGASAPPPLINPPAPRPAPAPVVVAATPGQVIDVRTAEVPTVTGAAVRAPAPAAPVTIPAVEGEYPGLSASIGTSAAPAATQPPATPTRATPAPAPVRTAAAPTATSAASPATGAWRIQLGAFSTRARAQTLWTSLSARLPGASPDYVAAGAVTRLQAGPYATRAAADRACAAVRPAACFAVGR